jgi:hypothetical protein
MFMMGLIILLVGFFYLGWWVALTTFSYIGVKKLTQSRPPAILASVSVFIVMYMIPFWDWYPTVRAHKHYCEAEAGLKIYKTPEQWDKENPGVLEGLVAYKKTEKANINGRVADKVNDHFGSVVSKTRVGEYPVNRRSILIIDIDKNEKLVEQVNFIRGYGQFSLGGNKISNLKFWLYKNSCYSYDEEVRQGLLMLQFANAYKMQKER